MLGMLASHLRSALSRLAFAAPPRQLLTLGTLDRKTRSRTASPSHVLAARGLYTTSSRLASTHDLDSAPSSSSSSARGRPGAVPFLQRQSTIGKAIKYDPLARVRAALRKRVPTSFPAILDSRLVDLLAGNKTEQLDPAFRSAYHPEVLEFLGDRIWDAVVAQSLVLLAARGQSTKKILGTIGLDIAQLLSNAHGAKLAEEFNLVHWSGKPCFGKASCSSDAAADAWEAHLGALYLANGRQAVLDFLVPLVERDFLKRSKPTSTAPPVLKLGTDTISPVALALRPVAVDPSSARVVDPPSALIANPASASVVDPLSAPGALPPSAPVVEAPSAAAVDPTVAIDSWQSAFAAAETSPVPRPLRKSPKGSLKKKPLVYKSHKLAIENVLADLTERGVDFLMLKAKRVYRFRVAGGPELVAKRTLQESDRVGSFVSQLVKADLVQISKKPTKSTAKPAPPA